MSAFINEYYIESVNSNVKGSYRVHSFNCLHLRFGRRSTVHGSLLNIGQRVSSFLSRSRSRYVSFRWRSMMWLRVRGSSYEKMIKEKKKTSVEQERRTKGSEGAKRERCERNKGLNENNSVRECYGLVGDPRDAFSLCCARSCAISRIIRFDAATST